MVDNVAHPLVTVVTPCWNSAQFIEKTILSVITQTYDNIEYIIIDGGSTDGTLDIIKKYKNNISFLLSESDAGMYQAINKGLARATGDIVAYLNSDDIYFPNTLSRVVDLFNTNPGAELIYGDLDFVDERGVRICTKKYPKFNWTRFAATNYAMIGQPSAFWRKELLDRVGLFDESMKMAADFDFFVRAGLEGNLKHVDDVLAAFRIHPKSLTSKQLALSQSEVSCIHKKYLPGRRGLFLVAFISDIFFKMLNWKALASRFLLKLRKC